MDGATVPKGDFVTKISLKHGPPIVNAKILRSGERGMLIYEAHSNKVQFKLWDDVTAVERPYNQRIDFR